MEVLDHAFFMREALKEAEKAYEEGEIPVGAVVVAQGRIIGKGYNQVEKLLDATAHAEMLALTAAANYLGSKYLENCALYVTLEPCVMCAGAISWAKPSLLVMGASDPKKGYQNYTPSILLPKMPVIKGILQEECEQILFDFFRNLRE